MVLKDICSWAERKTAKFIYNKKGAFRDETLLFYVGIEKSYRLTLFS